MNKASPNRLNSVKAGWCFNAYVYDHLPPDSGLSIAAEKELAKVFINPWCTLEKVKKEYQEGRGSNDILAEAFHGFNDHVLLWFRVGQTTMGLVAASAGMDAQSFEFEAEATLTNMGRVGLSENQVQPVFKLIEEFRTKIDPQHNQLQEASKAMMKIDRFLQSAASEADLNAEKQKEEDILEVKPGFAGISLNINALWRKLRK